MIKIYFDWNVLSQMKNGMHSDLNEIILNNNNLLIPFSTCHISDISSSFKDTLEQKKYIKSDLEYISTVTKEYCLFNNGKEIILDFYNPKELFEESKADKDKFNDISINGIMKNFKGDDELTRVVKPIFDLIRSIPLDDSFKKAFETPESSEIMEKIFPGLKENLTMEGFFESFSKMNYSLNELEGYKDLRQTVQKGTGINRDKIFDTKNPFEFIQKTYNRLGFNPDNYKTESKNSPKWFDDISNAYLKLDMHGYQEDKVNIKKGRKETFKNTTDDASHAAFASTCNFYVINDNKSYRKTKEVFKELNINTAVFKPNEFLDFYNKFLSLENSVIDLNIMHHLLQSDDFHESKAEDGTSKTYLFPYFIFGFFNKIMCFIPDNNEEDNLLILSQNKPTNWFILDKEVDNLINRLLEYFGNDVENKMGLKKGEFNKKKWDGRKWHFEKFTLRLQAINGYVQLYWDYEKENPEGNNVYNT
jgi:hypothetical protein